MSKLVTRLRDVEEQLWRTTAIVQLHLRKVNGEAIGGRRRSARSSVKSADDLRVVVGRIERLEGELQDATTRILVLARRTLADIAVEKPPDEGDTETEDELEEVEVNTEAQMNVKLEPPVLVLAPPNAAKTNNWPMDQRTYVETRGYGARKEIEDIALSHTRHSTDDLSLLPVEPMASIEAVANDEGSCEVKAEVNATAVAEEDEGLAVQKMAQVYLDIARQTKNSVESAVRAQQADASWAFMEKMSADSLLKELKNMATAITQRVAGDLKNGLVMSEGTLIQFSEATVLMVSIVTLNEPTNDQRDWLVDILQTLNCLLEFMDRRELVTPLLPIQECCVKLESYFFSGFSDPVEEAHDLTQPHRSMVASIDSDVSDNFGGGANGDLGERITSLLSETVKECDSFSRQSEPDTREQDSFVHLCQELSRCMDQALQWENPPLIEFLPLMMAKLHWFNAQFRGRIPTSLLQNGEQLIRRTKTGATKRKEVVRKRRRSEPEAEEDAGALGGLATADSRHSTQSNMTDGVIDSLEQKDKGTSAAPLVYNNHQHTDTVQSRSTAEPDAEGSGRIDVIAEEATPVQKAVKLAVRQYLNIATLVKNRVLDEKLGISPDNARKLIASTGAEAKKAGSALVELFKNRQVPDQETAENFSTATTLLTATCKSPWHTLSPKLLNALTSNLEQIVRFAERTQGLSMLASSCLEMIKCKESMTGLDVMERYVRTIQAQFVDPKSTQNLPHMQSLAKQFLADVRAYSDQLARGGTPRTQEDWKRFTELGRVLAEWMDRSLQAGRRLELSFARNMLDVLTRFDVEHTGIIPPSLLTTLERMY